MLLNVSLEACREVMFSAMTAGVVESEAAEPYAIPFYDRFYMPTNHANLGHSRNTV